MHSDKLTKGGEVCYLNPILSNAVATEVQRCELFVVFEGIGNLHSLA